MGGHADDLASVNARRFTGFGAQSARIRSDAAASKVCTAPEQPDWSWNVGTPSMRIGYDVHGGRHQHVGSGGAEHHRVDVLGPGNAASSG